MSINRKKLLRGLSYQIRDRLDKSDDVSAEIFTDFMRQVDRGKYDETWADRLIPTLLFIFSGMMLGLIILGILLEL